MLNVPVRGNLFWLPLGAYLLQFKFDILKKEQHCPFMHQIM